MNASDDIPTDEHRIATGLGTLHAQRWIPRASRGTLIVLFHDSLGCVALWRDFPAKLAARTRRTVIAYDRLGFGRSSTHPGALDRGFVHDEARNGFHHLREALAIGPFIAFGHSVGGGMAIGGGAHYPDACRALITEAAQVFVEDRTLTGIAAAERTFAAPGQLDRLARYHGDKARWVLDAWIGTWSAPSFASWNLDDALASVRCPVLAIHGEHDEYGSTDQPQRIAQHCPSRVTIWLPACGHVPHREMPDTVLTRVVQWLASEAIE